MSAAHTPGPWRLTIYKITEGEKVISYGWSIVDAKSRSVPLHSIDGSKQALANARLIAAAPELLEALQGALESMETGVTSLGVIRAARAAIAKATGGAL